MYSERPIDIDRSPSPPPRTHWTEELCDDCSPSRVIAVEAILRKVVYSDDTDTPLLQLVKDRLNGLVLPT